MVMQLHNITYGAAIQRWLRCRKKSKDVTFMADLAAQQDHMLANYAVAKIIHKGSTNNVSLDQALEFYKQAAFLGHAVSPIDIGQIYFVRNRSPRGSHSSFRMVEFSGREKCAGRVGKY